MYTSIPFYHCFVSVDIVLMADVVYGIVFLIIHKWPLVGRLFPNWKVSVSTLHCPRYVQWCLTVEEERLENVHRLHT